MTLLGLLGDDADADAVAVGLGGDAGAPEGVGGGGEVGDLDPHRRRAGAGQHVGH